MLAVFINDLHELLYSPIAFDIALFFEIWGVRVDVAIVILITGVSLDLLLTTNFFAVIVLSEAAIDSMEELRSPIMNLDNLSLTVVARCPAALVS